MSYGWLFESPDDDISGDNHINLEHLPPELKQVAIQIGEHEKPRGSHRMMPSTGVKITTIIS
ncbi:hypothetical protein [Klebsiella pneumoniae]|uniref:hypothetical protein n=1 Tax=Klebsiella pneumoniae TaxID=573 RepID=UPI004036AAA3